MIRTGYMNKYKEKSKYDDLKFKKDQDFYQLTQTRPITEQSITNLPKDKFFQFIEDVLTNKRLTSVLYASNAIIEIKAYLNAKKNFNHEKDEEEKKKKEKNEPSSVVLRRQRREAYVQMRTEIDDFKKRKKRYKYGLSKDNFAKYKEIKAELAEQKKNYFGDIKENYIHGFKRAYTRIKAKVDELKENGDAIRIRRYKGNINYNSTKNMTTQNIQLLSTPNLNNNEKENTQKESPTIQTLTQPMQTIQTTETEMPIFMRPSYEPVRRRIYFPDVKLNMKNVYSRLYNNAVLPKVYISEKEEEVKDGQGGTGTSTVKKKRRPLSSSINKLSNSKRIEPNPKINFNLKNVLKTNNGKEFTIKVTEEILRRCFNKYSGGPTTLEILQNQPKCESTKRKDKEPGYFVNFYELTEKGNSFLHLATEENYPQLVKYFIDKGADINMQNNEGNTPLHIALKKGYKKIIKILMDNKAALDIPNSNGDIPFESFTPEMKKEYGVDKILVINPVKKK